MKKNFVFDTNVLLNYPHALLRFADNNIVVPITVIEELDKFKHESSSLGRNAREAVRIIDRHRAWAICPRVCRSKAAACCAS